MSDSFLNLPPVPRTLRFALLAVVVAAISLSHSLRAAIVWNTAGNLGTPRSAHTATLLPTGKVLIYGGAQSKENGTLIPLHHAELFDPVTRLFSPVDGSFYERLSHRATLLYNGRVLVTGGNLDARAEELFDPSANTWYATTRMLTPRTHHTATRLFDGRVLVVGGFNSRASPGSAGYLSTAEIYDPVTQKWTDTGSLSLGPRYWHTANLLPDGRVLVAGGIVYDPKNFSDPYFGSGHTAEIYDPASGQWTAVGSMFHERINGSHRATTLADGRVVVTGGFFRSTSYPSIPDVEVFNPASLAFYSVGDLQQRRRFHDGILLLNGKAMIAGGLDTNEKTAGGFPLTSTELYDPATWTWTTVGDMNVARYQHTLTALPDGRVLAAGGLPRKTAESTAELFISGHAARVKPAVLSPAALGRRYTQEFAFTGGTVEPIGWTVTAGKLPAGLRLDPVKGALTGIPTKTGTFGFTIRATTGEMFGENAYKFVVEKSPKTPAPRR